MNLQPLYDFCHERYMIYLRRQSGQEAPWTEDVILSHYRFCNIYREDDRTTVWIRENIREPLRNDPKVLFAMCVCRWINRIESLDRIKHLLLGRWDFAEAHEELRGIRPVTNPAYLIKTPNGFDKLTGVMQVLRGIYPDLDHLTGQCDPGSTTLQGLHEVLMSYPLFGPFMSYEIVTDLRHTWMGEQAPDISTWCSPGPGCARGLSRIMYGVESRFWHGSAKQRKDMLAEMSKILDWFHEHWPSEWPRWEMREVEHVLCEFDKYERARLGQGRPKQIFRPYKEQ